VARLQPTGVFAEEKIELFALFFVLFFQLFVLLNGGKASILTFFMLFMSRPSSLSDNFYEQNQK